jgi:hypothetical protein
VTWEYLIVALSEFSRPSAAPGASDAVNVLNREGSDGWEAVGLTPLSEGGFAVLMKRPASG